MYVCYRPIPSFCRDVVTKAHQLKKTNLSWEKVGFLHCENHFYN